MEKSNKRGKIPQSDWPLIMTRYEAGETLASIARTYGCSPPAISYVVSRSRARQPAKTPPPPAASGTAEPVLVKAEAAPAIHRSTAAADAANGSAITAGDKAPNASPARPGSEPAGDRGRQAPLPLVHEASPAPRAAPAAGAANVDHRRTLHLSLGNGGHQHGDGAPSDGGAQQHAAPGFGERGAPAPVDQQDGERNRFGERHGGGVLPPRQAGGQRPGPIAPERSESFGERGRDANPGNGNGYYRLPEPSTRKEGGGSINSELRARVDADVAAFLAAFDAALAEDNQENRSALREATDRLLRAGARTRIELERLEARVPLPRRDPGMAAEPVWRLR
jgi:hypothetical protein